MKSKETWMRLAWSWLNRKGLSNWRTTFVWCWQVLRPFLSRSWVTTKPRVINVAEFSFWLLSFHSWLLNMWGWPRVVVLFRIYPSPVTVTVFHVLASPLTRLLVSRFGKEEITRVFSFAATDNALVHPCVPGLMVGGGQWGHSVEMGCLSRHLVNFDFHIDRKSNRQAFGHGWEGTV